MLTKEQFLTVLKRLEDAEAFIDKLENLHIDVLAIDDLFIFSEIADILFRSNFGEKGADLINQFIYEYCPQEITELDGSVTTLSTKEELYDYLIKNDYR